MNRKSGSRRDHLRNGAAVRRRRGRPRWLRPAARAALIAAAVAVAFGGPAWLWRSGRIATAIVDGTRSLLAWSADIGLTVQDVTLEGRTHTLRRHVVAAIGLRRGDPLFGFDPGAIRSRLVALPWVREATVQRQLPGTVRVRIVERLPLALWQRNGRLMLVDDRGVVITRKRLQRFRDLLIIVGDDAPEHAADLIAMLGNEPVLAQRVGAAVRVGKRRWNLELKSGIKVRLPETGAAAAWRKLARLDRKHRLLDRKVKAVDLRQPDRIYLVTPSGIRPVTVTVERNT
jgi:cell division protein FtsQ